MPSGSRVTARGSPILLRFYFPISLTMFLTGVSHYIVAAAMTRSAGSTVALACYALAQSFMMMFEQPAVAMRTAATALSHGPAQWQSVQRASLQALGITLGLQGLLFLTPLGPWVLTHLAGIGPDLVPGTIGAAQVMILAVTGSSLRFIYQGIQVRWRVTDGVLLGILARLAMMGIVAGAVTATGWPGGSAAGALILATGMLIEGFVGVLGYWYGKRRQGPSWGDTTPAVSVSSVFRFALPLALSGLALVLVRPFTNAGLVQVGAGAVASFGLTFTVTTLLQAPVFSLHQVSVVYGGQPGGAKASWRFSLALGGLFSAVNALICVPGVGRWILGSLIGAPAELIPSALLAIAAHIPVPVLMAMTEHQAGLLFLSQRSRAVSIIRLVRLGITLGMIRAALSISPAGAGPGMAQLALTLGFALELVLMHVAVRVDPAAQKAA